MSQKQTFRIRECGGMECSGIEEGAPVVKGVKLLGETSLNRRRYLPESVVPSQYERAPVYLNHTDGKTGRLVQDKFGWIESAIKEGADWRGDLHYNPKHPYAEQFTWLAQHNPSQIGLSHDAVGQGRTENGVFIVEKVISVKSVDLVADPATTKGLFEAMDPELDTQGDGGEDLKTLEDHVKNAVAAMCVDGKLSDAQKMEKFKAALKLLEDPEEEEGEVEEEDEEEEGKEEEDEEEEKKTEESLSALVAKVPGVKKLVEQIDTLKTKLALKEREELSAKLIAEAKLPNAAVTETFVSLLSEAKDEAAMRKLIEDRKALASIQKPRSGGPANKGVKESKISDDEWLKRLKGK